jgi:hypothetical protein
MVFSSASYGIGWRSFAIAATGKKITMQRALAGYQICPDVRLGNRIGAFAGKP